MSEKKSKTGNHRLPPPFIVDSPADLNGLYQGLKNAKRIAVDTESNSLFAYHSQVCLIQLSTEYEDFLIDPINLNPQSDLATLGEIFADPGIEKILHAAEYDVMMLRHNYGYDFANIFDTMIAARVLGWQQTGLGSILEDRYKVKLNKRHQRANWGKRPIPQDMLRYAQMDTHFLLDLRDEMYALLVKRDRLEEAGEMFDDVCLSQWNGSDFDPEGYWRIKDTKILTPRQLAILAELYVYREREAEKQNVPPFKVMGDRTLIALSQASLRTTRDLDQISQISPSQRRRYSRQILSAVKRGENAEPPSRPNRRLFTTDDSVSKRYDALQQWRKEKGIERDVPSDVILSRDALWELAHLNPQTIDELEKATKLGPWRKAKYGADILRVLKRVH